MVSVLGGSVGVTVSAGVLVSARRNRKKAERRGAGVKGGGVRQTSNCSNRKERSSVTPLFVLEIVLS